MDLQDLGSLGELIGAVATVATLVYLTIQVRHNTRQLRENAEAGRARSRDESLGSFSRYRNLISIPENAEIYVKGLDSYSDLKASEKVRFKAIVEEYFFANLVLSQRPGIRGDIDRPTAFREVLGSNGGREWWAERKTIFPVAFQKYVESGSPQQKPNEPR